MLMTSRLRERTVQRVFEIRGVGIHTGKASSVVVEPAPEGHGIVFFHKHAEGPEVVFDASRSVGEIREGERRSTIGHKDTSVETVEHLLSAFYGLGISNARVTVDGPEIPGCDGSAREFVERLLKAGLRNQQRNCEVYAVDEPLFVSEGQSTLAVMPWDRLKVTYTLDYAHAQLRAQTVSLEITEDVFRTQIAPARTFCTQDEARLLREKGYGKGADTGNTLIIGDAGPLENRLRFKDECARHKVLDLLGDLALLGKRICAHVIGIRSGHALNRRMVRLITDQMNRKSRYQPSPTIIKEG